MATTARLPDELKQEADAYAARLGISLNALIAVALRDYLDSRRTKQAAPTAHPPVVPARVEEAIEAAPTALRRSVLQAPAPTVRVVSEPKPDDLTSPASAAPAPAAAPAQPLTRQQRRALERQAGKRQPS